MAKKRKRPSAPKREQARLREREHTKGAALDVRQGGGQDAGWGTSPASLGEVKARSEEARMEKCLECGSAGGRHLRVCSRRPK